MTKPVIGIVLDLPQNKDKYSYAAKPWYALRACYSERVKEAGGVAMMIPYDIHSIESIIQNIDGLIIPGGDEDINPTFYGQEIISDKVKVNDLRANFELLLTQHALEINLPLLGICNGMQIINVVQGGTLIQHIPDVIKSIINHEQPYPKDIPTHSVTITQGTILASLSETSEIMVNSTHHQAIDKIGKDLVISARADDGIIEAIESVKHHFVIGVEWHSEYANSQLDKNLFSKLVQFAKNRK
ncbi:MAG: gamma-glutamyl-gamma-aminobutyrate hydrolase family protein [Rickettsiaceae bacterium]|nr:gamma-glutamyl-gamma-aminobutyrate hydrolase family protein [Rickettsiaceae bacterium]